MTNTLNFGLPAGSLQKATFELFAKAGWNFYCPSRSYYPTVDDDEIKSILMRPQEMPRYIEAGNIDAGICGKDWVLENNSDLHTVCEMKYNKATSRPASWVLAVNEDSNINSVKDLEGKRISTELVNYVKKWLADNGVKAEVEFSWGATEVKVPDLVDAIVDITETGSSLRANNLRIVETLVESYPVLVVSKEAWADEWKRGKLERMSMMLLGALNARGKAGLKMNVPALKLERICNALPALRNPTVSQLSDASWVAVEVIVEETEVRHIIPALKKLGAEGLIVYPLTKVID